MPSEKKKKNLWRKLKSVSLNITPWLTVQSRISQKGFDSWQILKEYHFLLIRPSPLIIILKCWPKGFAYSLLYFVIRQTVRDVLEALKPGRSELNRKNRLTRWVYSVKGPNHIWHLDGNDKLKRYVFCVSGCIDGFSRKLMWQKVARTNKNPDLIFSFFLDAIWENNLTPCVVRMDRGTENVHIASAQRLLRATHEDSLAKVAVMFGSSNQVEYRFEQSYTHRMSPILLHGRLPTWAKWSDGWMEWSQDLRYEVYFMS